MSQRTTGLYSERVRDKSRQKESSELSPKEHTRRGSLLQEYERKVGDVMQNSNLTFEKIETPGWSSLVESDISDKKLPRTADDILSKLVSLNGKSYEEVDRGRPLRAAVGELKSLTNLPMHPLTGKTSQRGNIIPTESRPQGPKVYIVDKAKISQPMKGSASSSKLPAQRGASSNAKKGEKRWRQIDVYEHLYLDSKKLQTKRMVEKIMDEELRNDLFKFHPTISQNSIFLAEQRQKKLQVDPFYRCTTRSPIKLPKKKTVVDPTEQQFKCLHALFYIMSNGTMTLDRESLNISQVPMPCLRSLEPLLEMIYLDRRFSWAEFLEQFYEKALSRKAFFHVLGEWIRRNEIDVQF